MPSTYTPIATSTAGSTISDFTFSSIPSTYTDLIVVVNGLGSDTSYKIRFNSDSGSNYSSTFLYGDGSSAASGRASSQTYATTVGRQNNGTTIMNIQNYSNTTTNKTMLTRGSAASNLVIATVSLWRSTAAIDSVLIVPETGSFNTGSTFTLYGVKSA